MAVAEAALQQAAAYAGERAQMGSIARHPDVRRMLACGRAEVFAARAIGLALAIKATTAAAGDDSVWIALLVGFASRLAFSGSTLLQHNAFEMKNAKLTVINTGYQLVLFLVMSLVLGLL